MKSSVALARVLEILERDGSVPASSIGQNLRRELSTLFDSGVLEEARRGSGFRVVVLDQSTLQILIQKLFPAGLEAVLDENARVDSRAQAVARFRNAKVASKSTGQPLLVRGFGKAVLRRGSEVLGLSDWTKVAGVAAVQLDNAQSWSLDGTIAVVENMESFLQAEQVIEGLDGAIYTGGRMSERMLDWLAGPALGKCRFIHSGDYDPVGIDEYLKLRQRCAGRVSLYLPSGLEELFKRFGKKELVTNSLAVLKRIRGCGDRDAEMVIKLMDEYGCGLEQEVLWI